MLCQKCRSANTTKIDTYLIQNNSLMEETWRCMDCQYVNRRLLPAIPVMAHASVINMSMAGGMVANNRLNRDEKIRQWWDELKRSVDGMTELDKLAVYFYLNKTGITISGIENRTEKLLNEKFKDEKVS